MSPPMKLMPASLLSAALVGLLLLATGCQCSTSKSIRKIEQVKTTVPGSPEPSKPKDIVAVVESPIEGLKKLSEEFNHAEKPLSQDDLSRFMEQGAEVLFSRDFDEEYQEIRAKAFDTGDFSNADKIESSVAPLFLFDFGGDYDIHLINYDTLINATSRGSPERRLLELSNKSFVSFNWDSPDPDLHCYFVPGLGAAGTPNRKRKVLEKLVGEWSTLKPEIKNRFLQTMVEQSIACLDLKPTRVP